MFDVNATGVYVMCRAFARHRNAASKAAVEDGGSLAGRYSFAGESDP